MASGLGLSRWCCSPRCMDPCADGAILDDGCLGRAKSAESHEFRGIAGPSGWNEWEDSRGVFEDWGFN